ncbi:MAG: LexA family protein [Candidatus Nealsonbacteria bacterium]
MNKNIHTTQQKILKLAKEQDINKMNLHEIGRLIGEEHPQKIKHHLSQLEKKGFLENIKGEMIIRKNIKNIVKKGSFFIVPILGSANAGEATIIAEEHLEGYLKISNKLLKKKKGVFAIRAEGSSMNRANVNGKTIENGDYVIIDSRNKTPNNGDYVLSIIDDVANIKKFILDKKNKQIVLLSESTTKFPPIFIHPEDFSKYLIGGKVVQVIKKPTS